MAPAVSTVYRFLDVTWQSLSFGLLPSGGILAQTTPQVFRFEAATSLPDHLGCLYLDDFYKMLSLSKAQAGGLCAARLELSPWTPTATVATWGRRFGSNADCRLGFNCPCYIADSCIGFRHYFQVWFLIPHQVYSLSDFRLSTNF